MLPAGLTIASVMTDAAAVVTEFGTLIVFVVGLSIGIYVVRFIIKQARNAVR